MEVGKTSQVFRKKAEGFVIKICADPGGNAGECEKLVSKLASSFLGGQEPGPARELLAGYHDGTVEAAAE